MGYGLVNIDKDASVMKMLQFLDVKSNIVLYIDHLGRGKCRQELLPDYYLAGRSYAPTQSMEGQFENEAQLPNKSPVTDEQADADAHVDAQMLSEVDAEVVAQVEEDDVQVEVDAQVKKVTQVQGESHVKLVEHAKAVVTCQL